MFTLTIELGNAAMQDASDVASALRTLADKLDGDGMIAEGAVVDINGNTVGRYEFE